MTAGAAHPLRRVLVRADGDDGRAWGLGHVMRGLAYVEALARASAGLQTAFAMRGYLEGMERVHAAGHPVLPLPENPEEADYRSCFRAFAPDLIILDTLGSSPDLQAAARAEARRVVTLDDLEPAAGMADEIINGIVYATRSLPERLGRARVHQGPQFIPLRPPFIQAHDRPRVAPPEVREILVSTGGADHTNSTPALMAALAGLPFSCHVTVMVGPAFTNLEAIQAASRSSERVRFSLVRNATDMAERMAVADLALITGGTVMFESAACGTPAIVLGNYPHMLPQIRWFQDQGAVLSAPASQGVLAVAATTERLAALARDPDRRQDMADRGRALVDGRGLERFVQIIQHGDIEP